MLNQAKAYKLNKAQRTRGRTHGSAQTTQETYPHPQVQRCVVALVLHNRLCAIMYKSQMAYGAHYRLSHSHAASHSVSNVNK